MIKSLNLEIIDICNLQCIMCDIWKNKNPNLLSCEDINNILSSKNIKKNIDITITGGEPLLYENIEDVFEKINNIGFSINTLSTNGILYNKLEKLILFCLDRKIKIPNIHISIDGLEKNNDLQRGISGSFKRSIETIIKLKKQFKNINIKIKYTITKQNISDIKSLFILSKKLKTDISFKIVENDTNYTNFKDVPELINEDEKNEIYKILFDIYGTSNEYVNNLLHYIKNDKLKFKCNSPINNIFIMANGNIYGCTKYNSIGNIKKENIDNILFNNEHNKIIKNIAENNCNKCFSLHGSYKSLN